MENTGRARPPIVVAMREWWNPDGHTVCTARAFDTEGGRVLTVFPDGHGTQAVAAEIRRQWELPDRTPFAFDSVRVSRRRDLHADPHSINMGRETVLPLGWWE